MIQNVINFKCNSCGKCCSQPPHVNFFEMLELSNEFIFQIHHQGVLSTLKNLKTKEELQHLESISHSILLPELEATLFYFIEFIPIQFPSHQNCSKLIDDLCSIYGKRPDSCKISPVKFSQPISKQEQITFFKSQSQKNIYKCDFSPQSPLFLDLKNNQLANHISHITYLKGVAAIRETTDLFLDGFLKFFPHQKEQHFKNILLSTQNNTQFISDVLFMLQLCLKEGLISPEMIETFLINQIQLIETELKTSTIFKIHHNLKISRFYKNLKNKYIDFLNKKTYKTIIQPEILI